MARTRDEDARRRVLDAASALTCEHGPRAVTVDAIAATAGVGRQTIYRWWPSKSAVIMDALIEMTDAEPADAPASSTRERIRLQMNRVARLFSSRQGQLIRELVADAQGDPQLAEDFRRRFFAHRRARGAATVIDGMASGELRPDLDVEDVLDVLYAPLWLRLLVGHQPASSSAVDDLLGLVWPGIVSPDAAPARPARRGFRGAAGVSAARPPMVEGG